MKKLVSLALLLALVFCVGVALADVGVGDSTASLYDGSNGKVDTPNYNCANVEGIYADLVSGGYNVNGVISEMPTCYKTGKCQHAMTDQAGDDTPEFYEHLIPALGHDYKDVKPYDYEYVKISETEHECYVKTKCTRCGDISRRKASSPFVEAHDFQWYPVTDGLIPCTENVPVKEVCSKCHYETGRTDVGHGKGHTKPNPMVKENVIPGTCHTKEEYDYTCTVCKEKVHEYGDIDPNNHVWGEPQPDKDPTCTQPGNKIRICWYEDAVDKTITVPAHGHDWSEGFYLADTDKPTCSAYGVMTYVCTNEDCDALTSADGKVDAPSNAIAKGYDDKAKKAEKKAWYQANTAMVAHTYDTTEPAKDYQAANCTTAGYADYECTECGQTGRTIIDPLGHDWDDGKITYTQPDPCENPYYVTYICQRDGCNGYLKGEDEKTNDGATGNTTKGIAKKTVEMPAPGHDWSDWETRVEYQEGVTNGMWERICNRCLKAQTRTGTSPDNIFKYDVITPATCEEDGEQTVYEYDRDTKELVRSWNETIPATGHDYKAVDAVAPTHTKPGKTAGERCANCGDEKGITETEEALKEGLCNGKDGCETDGEFVYFKDGEAYEYTGLTDYEGGTFYVVDGKIATDANGVTKVAEGEFYWLAYGKVAKGYTGLATYDGTLGLGWFALENGRVRLDYTGLWEHAGHRFVVSYGQYIPSFNGFYWAEDGVWYCEGGVVIVKTGVVEYNGHHFSIENGKLVGQVD